MGLMYSYGSPGVSQSPKCSSLQNMWKETRCIFAPNLAFFTLATSRVQYGGLWTFLLKLAQCVAPRQRRRHYDWFGRILADFPHNFDKIWFLLELSNIEVRGWEKKRNGATLAAFWQHFGYILAKCWQKVGRMLLKSKVLIKSNIV